MGFARKENTPGRKWHRMRNPATQLAEHQCLHGLPGSKIFRSAHPKRLSINGNRGFRDHEIDHDFVAPGGAVFLFRSVEKSE